jgi:omega-hydroxy-beta-dihydromenaquinone-9 sulfotransferase
LTNTKQIFVVGNSRSGTTMMGRIIGKHSSVFTFKELHFFGQLWSLNDRDKLISKKDSVKLFSKLLSIQKYGIFNQRNPEQFTTISESILLEKECTRLDVFNLFLNYIAEQNNSVIACDQTPRNAFYIQEILDNFPNAKIVNMVRDPRDVLLSQKNKWKRRYFGASGIPFREAIRSYFNYHPITISKIWNTSILNAKKFEMQKSVKTVKFEDLLLNPKSTISELCSFLELDFDENMLKVPNIGSSTNLDKESVSGVDKSKIGNWKKGGLKLAEIYICQKMCSENMNFYKYENRVFNWIPLFAIISIFTFPIKISVSFILNLHRIKNFNELVQKRILNR